MVNFYGKDAQRKKSDHKKKCFSVKKSFKMKNAALACFAKTPKTKVNAQKKKVESKKCFSVRQKKPKSEKVEKKKRNFLW